MKGIVTLTTDFGSRDPFVGVMKGVMLGVNPELTLVDLTHGIEPGKVFQAAFLLENSAGFFPPGTVHLVVVDPGVGGPRRAIAVRNEKSLFVGPDNGCLGRYLPGDDAVEITNPELLPEERSRTFHGRDVFAPAAAHLASGLPLRELGPPVFDPVVLDPPGPKISGDVLEARVMHVDRFGNLVTCLNVMDLFAFAGTSTLVFKVGELSFGTFVSTYSDAPEGSLMAYEGSGGYLEIGVARGSAADLTGAAAGDEVVVFRKD